MKKVLFSKTPEDLMLVAAKILEEMSLEHIFAFYGEMGAGKTTLIKAFCHVLGSSDVVHSPTFSLVNEYEDKMGRSLYHFDFYRIKHLEEVYDIGFEEYIDSGDYCFLEWPEQISELLPKIYVYVSIEVNGDGVRKITYSLQN
ncbi:tRNA threonylcarbamoyladenosine biosynthesis protein TsaE [hydrothermal vent metagenome]|uniref:tRNA threonylcarbamoyladenosine biosynthesis protein TsaE n=1 Tax=hydrothermal vent metagenome TaxID=652676 RepID=A0A3B0V7X5_9ZZZZ